MPNPIFKTVIFAQRTEKVKVRISGSAGPFRSLRRGPRHDGSGVRKVYFLHSAAPWPHLVRVSPGISADTVAKIIMQIVCRGAGFLHSTVIAQDEGQEAHPLGAFYLFGALGKNSRNGAEEWHSFWADSPGEETQLFQQFLAVVGPLEDACLYTYGSYEATFLRRMIKQSGQHERGAQILARVVNVLSLVYAHVYFPTYSNSLKDIGRYLGFDWTAPDASVCWPFSSSVRRYLHIRRTDELNGQHR